MASRSKEVIYARAREEGVSTKRIDACFEKMTEYAARNNNADKSPGWVEKLVWEHYFPGEPFTGKGAVDNEQSSTRVEPAGPSRLDRIFSNETSFTRMVDESDSNGGRPWVHDKFSATLENSDRKENRPSTRVSDYYPAVSGRLDSYKPSGSSLRTSIDSYRPRRDDDMRSTPSPSKRRLSHSEWDNIPTGPAASRDPDQTLKQMVISAGYGAKQYEATQLSCQEQVKAKHSEKVLSSEWLKWKEECLIWRQFFHPKPFPFREPSWAGPKSGFEGHSPVKYEPPECSTPSGSSVKASASATATAEEVDKRGIPVPTEYSTLEKRMEAMVKDRGGADLRRQFFQYLQRMRDKANYEHRDCDKSVRAFMADGLTWKKFFDEPSPGRKPLGGHTKACIQRSNTVDDTAITTQTRSRQPLMTVTNQTRPIVRLPTTKPPGESTISDHTFGKESPEAVSVQPPATSAAAVPSPTRFQLAESPTTARTPKNASPEYPLIIQGNQISCSIDALKDISYSIIKDNKYELVGKALNCEFIIRQRAEDNGLRLTAIPLKADGDDTSAADRGAGFLQSWVREVLKRGPIEMSSYWLDFCTANGVPQNLVDGIRNGFLMYDKEAATGDTSRGKSWAGPSETLACPEQQWEQYAKVFAASNIDRLVIEETAKAEGLLRMVYDEEVGDVISLGEYKKRILCRFVGIAHIAEATNGKRKAEEESTDREEKRIKVEK